jgi:hypothetical protein
MDEYWATFSIYDHRTPAFRRALLLFDRVVIPVPTTPYKSLTSEELLQLSADTDWLAAQGAAVRFDWSPQQFAEWTQSVAGQGLASVLGQDRQLDTRLQGVEWALKQGYTSLQLAPSDVPNVTAVPVYGPAEPVDEGFPERATFEVVFEKLPVPEHDAPLEDICRLRESPAFAGSLRKLRLWQEEVMLDLLDAADNEQKRKIVLRRASRQLDDWAEGYRNAMGEARFNKVESGLSVLAALGKLLSPIDAPGTLLEMPEKLVKARTVRRPCWKEVNEMPCAPAGVIYWTERRS